MSAAIAIDLCGPIRARLDGLTPLVAALSLLSALLMLGQGERAAAMPALVACVAALATLCSLNLAYRRARERPHHHPRDKAMPVEAAALPVAPTRARVLYLVSHRQEEGTRRTAERGAAPLQRLAQAQGDQRFLIDCRRNVSARWLHLLEEVETAWARGRIGEMRWPLYQLRMQTTLWGATSPSRKARELERLLGGTGMLGFEYRCGRSLASLRAALEGRPVGD
jgi:hypothetical protein